MFLSIRSRLLGLVLATVVPFTALIAFGLYSQWRTDEAVADDRAIAEARLLAAQVDDHIGNIESLLKGVALAVSTDRSDVAKNDAILSRSRDAFLAEFPGLIGNILLFSLDGSDIGRSGVRTGQTPAVRDRKYFRQVIEGQRQVVGDVMRGSITGLWKVFVARAVEDETGRPRGVLAVSIVLENFQKALKTDRLPKGTIVSIISEEGRVVARSAGSQEWVGRDLSDNPAIKRRFAEKEVSESSVWPSDHVSRVTGSVIASRAPWLVAVGVPSTLVFNAMLQRLSLSAAFVAVAGLAAFVIAWMLSGRIARPLRQLDKDASILASGNLNHRTEVETRGEVGALAAAFNRMASSLERRQEEATRTADELRRAKDTLSAVIDASQVAIVCSDPARRIVLWNRAAVEMFGYATDEVLGRETKIVPPGGFEVSQNVFRRAFGGETVRGVEVKRMRKDGSFVDVRVSAAPMYHPDGTVRGVAWAYEDVTERLKVEEQLRRLAHFDPLTGLPNRLSLEKELGRRLAGDHCEPCAIALFDLDDFKQVNDMLGHSAGDELLIEVGHRLSEVAQNYRSVGPVCRLGGDEFIVLMPGCGDPRRVTEVVEAMLKRLGERLEIAGQIHHPAGCAGIAIAPRDGTSATELITNADLALYQAKSVGGRTYRLFLPVLRSEAQARHVLTSELRRAFERNEFELYFQPQVRLADDVVAGVETLLRWRNPERGILAPGAFIQALADSVIAPDVGRWILRSSCEQLAAWRASGLQIGRVGVNLFPAQAHGGGLVKDVEDALRDSGLPAHALEIEITENIALQYQDAIDPLKKLHDMGVRLAFDDFGTGYASLSYLTRLPLSHIKIDRCFVAKVTEDRENSAIVRSLIMMAHNLGLGVIAEGVETEAQASFLRDEGCEEVQGYLYAKPLPAAEFEEYVRSRAQRLDASAASAPQARAG
jgi:diguanylate cyclase (GGDEF)-like protein/PAS domain S-box-containing protein